MVRVFVNGKEVSKKDLEKIEIKSEAVNRIISERFLRKAEGEGK